MKYSLGIIGYPLGHTLSPVMHKAAAKKLGMQLEYKPYEVAPEALGEFMSQLRDMEVDGLNITVPHKVEVMQHLDGFTDEASAMGAVNTIYRDGSRLIGDNTDGYGFIESLRQNGNRDPRGKTIFVYGAGGAARAVLLGLARSGAKHITIANRTLAKAKELAAGVKEYGSGAQCISPGDHKLVDSVGAADIIVNTTSVGMEGVEEKALPGMVGIGSGSLAVDIVYRPLRTEFLACAEDMGAATLDGLWMLIHQGGRSFLRWTGREFPIEFAREILLSELSGNQKK